MRAKDALGRWGEDLAAQHLQDAGMTILERNWRCDLGELDIVARDGDTLVVCEVKTRSSLAFGSPLEAVTEQKASRLQRLAARWLTDHELRVRDLRYDLIGIVKPREGSVTIDHVRGVM